VNGTPKGLCMLCNQPYSKKPYKNTHWYLKAGNQVSCNNWQSVNEPLLALEVYEKKCISDADDFVRGWGTIPFKDGDLDFKSGTLMAGILFCTRMTNPAPWHTMSHVPLENGEYEVVSPSMSSMDDTSICVAWVTSFWRLLGDDGIMGYKFIDPISLGKSVALCGAHGSDAIMIARNHFERMVRQSFCIGFFEGAYTIGRSNLP